MIYTTNLKESTCMVLVFNKNQPLDIVGLSFGYNPMEEYNFDVCVTKEDWAKRVQSVLERYATKKGLDIKELSARPIEYCPDCSLMLGEVDVT